MIELTFLKDLILIKQVLQKSAIYYWYFLDKGCKFQPDVWNGCHDDVLITSINLSDIAIPKIHGVTCHIIISGISKSEAANLLQKADLNKKSGTL